jgi:hypothetical protein
LKHINTNQLKIEKEIVDAFKIDGFNYILTIFNETNKNNKYLYKKLKENKYNIYEPPLNQLITNSYINKKTTLAIILYKLRIYHIFMPTLRKIQQNLIIFKIKKTI